MVVEVVLAGPAGGRVDVLVTIEGAVVPAVELAVVPPSAADPVEPWPPQPSDHTSTIITATRAATHSRGRMLASVLTPPAYLRETAAILRHDALMPEIPDIEAYIAALRLRVDGDRLLGVRVRSPFFLRTVEPPLATAAGRRVVGVRRMGKRIVVELEARSADRPDAGEPLFLVLHLMIAGRLHWRPAGAGIPKGAGLAALDFEGGTLLVTEAGTTRRASLRVLEGRQALAEADPGGVEVLACDAAGFAAALRRENHTLKRALTDPHIVSGIGNAYSDEILHRAGLSPLRQTRTLADDDIARLHEAAVAVLREWTQRLLAEAGEGFPEKVTAFRTEMAVHGKFGTPCPVCGSSIQRIVYAENECDYCPQCQTGGRVLADRALSRLLRDDWQRVAGERIRPPGADDRVPED